MENSFGDRYLYSVNKMAFSRVGAATLYRSSFGDQLFAEDSFYLIGGTDSGLLPQYIKKRGVPKGSRYLFVELPEVLQLIGDQLATLDDESIIICTTDRWLETAKEHHMTEYLFMDAVRPFKSFAVVDNFHTAYREAWRIIEERYKEFQWELSTHFGSYVFTQTKIENLAENRIPAQFLRNHFSGQTAAVLGGGPSLTELLPWIKEHRNSLTIIAVSRIARQLIAAEINPDIIVSVDPYPIGFDVCKEALKLSQKTLLVHTDHVSPLLASQWHGRHCYSHECFPWHSEHNPENITTEGPTVTNSAISMAFEMGFSRIVLAGLDLCHSREGFTHAKGSNEHDSGPWLGSKLPTVKTNGGWIAEAEPSLYFAIGTLTQQAKKAEHYHCQMINPAAGAAAIEGIDYIPVANIELAPTPRPAHEVIDALFPDDDRDSRLRHYTLVLRELDHAGEQLKALQKLTKEALECNDGLFGRNGKKQSFKYKIRMDKIEKKINRHYKEFADFAKLFGIKEFTRTMRITSSKADDLKDHEIEEMGRVFYSAYLSGSDKLLEIINEARLRTADRIEEEQEHPDLERLIKRWRKDGQPGRALIWRDRYEKRHGPLPAEWHEPLELLRKQHEDNIENRDSIHNDYCKDLMQLRGIDGKAQELFEHRDSEGLNRLISGLKKHKQEAATPLLHFAEGLLAELEQREEDAIHNYQYVHGGPAQERALTRLTCISLTHHDLDSARIALECLRGISPAYLPKLADLSRIMGDTARALDLYTEYLSLVPDDLSTMMKLGLLYRELGVKEGAQWVFGHILEKDPGNHAAQSLLKEATA